MTTIKVNDITNVAGTGAPNFSDGIKYNGAALSTLNTYEYTSSATEPSNPNNGALWWDSANSQAKIYVNNSWKTVTLSSADSTPRSTRGSRGWSSGGLTSESATDVGGNNLQYFDISTQSSTTIVDGIFGTTYGNKGLQSNGTRGSDCLIVGGNSTGNDCVQLILKFNSATLGSAQSHGSLVSWLSDNSDPYASYDNDTNQNWMNNGSVSDGDRCVFQAGYYHGGNNGVGSFHADIGYCSIETAQDAQNFGDLTQARRGPASGNDATRAVFSTGEPNATNGTNRIDYITIQTTGDATDFGDYTYSMRRSAGASNGTRFLQTGGRYNSGSTSTLYNTHTAYITIQTTGNAATFGNLTVARQMHSCMSDGTYCVTSCGRTHYANGTNDTKVQEYQVFDTLGNATQFSDLAGKHHEQTSGGSGNAS